MFPAAIYCCTEICRLPPGACMWSPHSHWPSGCHSHEDMAKGRTSAWCECVTRFGKERERERALCFPRVITRSLALGWTEWFFKMTNQLPKLWWAFESSTSYLDWQDAKVKLLPLHTLVIWSWRDEGGVLNPLAGAMLQSPGVEAVASWWSKQAYDPQFVKLNV